MADHRVTALTGDEAYRVVWIEADDIAAEVVSRHELKGRMAVLASELVVANLLLAAYVKGEERVSLQVQGSHPRLTFHGQAWADGVFRARVSPETAPGSSPALHGLMLAIKDDGRHEMYRGMTEVKGEVVADALQRHLTASDQVTARVRMDIGGGRARGLLVERIPDAADVSGLAAAQVMPDWVDGTMEDIGNQLVFGLAGGEPVVPLQTLPLTFRCLCSRERVEAMLLGLGASDLQAMRDEDSGAEVTCEFCRETYRFDEDALEQLLAMARAPEV